MGTSDGERIIEISAQMDALAHERSRVVARFDANRDYQAYGSPNTVAFLKSHCRMGSGTAMELQAVARRLPELPVVEAALSQGEIGFDHAAVIAESADRLGSEALLERQEELVDKAEAADPSSLRHEVKKVELQVDAERMAKEAEWAYRSRYLKVSTWRDGRVRVDGLLDPEGGAMVKTAFDAALGPRAKDEVRSEPQRRADALVDVARRALDGRQFGETGRQAPHVNAIIDVGSGTAAIASLGPVTKETIERLLCDCSLSVNGGREMRTFSAPLRRSVTGRGAHCHFPRCDRPAAWCDGHHVEYWRNGGRTVAENAALLCGFHHRLVHEGGWRLVSQDGALVAISPDGEKFRSSKAPPAA